MSQKRADEPYAVFFRPALDWDRATNQVAASLEVLDHIIETACEGSAWPPQSSVFGRFVIVPRQVETALELCARVVTDAANAGIKLTAGVARGKVVETEDFDGTNFAGKAINLAARLAQLSHDADSPVRVDANVVDDAVKAYGAQFSEERNDHEKSTPLTFRLLNAAFPAVAAAPVPNATHKSENGFFVLYDVVRYSGRPVDEMADLMESLRHHVRRALDVILDDRTPIKAGVWYGPAGDGGVIVFRANRGRALTTLRFAQDLLDYANEPKPKTAVCLRVGVSRGQFAVIKNNVPVGQGISEANRLANAAYEGSACISRNFWNESLEPVQRIGWRAEPASEDEDALHVTRASDPPPQTPTPAVHACRLLADGIEGACALIVDGRFALTARALTHPDGARAKELTVFAPGGSQFRAEVHQDIEKYGVAVLRLESRPPDVELLLLSEVSEVAISPNMAVSEFHVSRPAPDLPLQALTARHSPGPSLVHEIWQQRISFGMLGASGGEIAATLNETRLRALVGSPVLARGGAEVIGIVVECSVYLPEGGQAPAVDSSGNEAMIVPVGAFRHMLDIDPPGSRSWYLTVLSDADHRAKPNRQLRTIVHHAAQQVGAARKLPVSKKPNAIYGSDAVLSLGDFAKAVREICRAEVVVFDITRYEPAVLLLAGIRAVVRRGVTILSMGGESGGRSIVELPFNLKDANFVDHSSESFKYAGDKHPTTRIKKRIDEGLSQMGSRDYLDLPAYDAVRNLPPGERGAIAAAEAVLALVSFDPDYEQYNWNDTIRPALEHHQNVLRQTLASAKAKIGVVRSLDLDSPRLVSHAIYGYIRRAALCVVDWTGWRPNVFFELGVRIAASDGDTVCLIQEGYRVACKALTSGGPETSEHWVNTFELANKSKPRAVEDAAERLMAVAPQAVRLFNLFHCLDYARYATAELFEPVFKAGNPTPESGTIPIIREIVSAFINPLAEPGAVPVHRELLESAKRFLPNDTEGAPAILFMENPRLKPLVTASTLERMKAAWLALMSAYPHEEIMKDKTLRNECDFLIKYLTDNRKHFGALFEEIKNVKRMLNAANRQDAARREAM